MAKRKKAEEETTETADTKNKTLELALAAMEKQFGKGIILTGSGAIPGLEWLSSGCPSLNKALSGSYDKGYPRGRIIEVYGPESSGKTTLCLHAVAEAQKQGDGACYVDAEHALDPIYAANLGVDMDALMVSQPSSGEQALQVVEQLVKTGALGIVVVDSVAALVPQAEIEKEIGDSVVGRQALLMSQAMRKLSGACHRSGTTLMFINQLRMKIGVMFGNPETTPGGNALKFYASQRLDIRRTGGVKEGEEFVANSTRVKVVKNRVSPPFRQAEFEIVYGQGINVMKDLLRIAVDTNVINKSGAWYAYDGSNFAQGEAKATEYLSEHPELIEQVTAQLSA